MKTRSIYIASALLFFGLTFHSCSSGDEGTVEHEEDSSACFYSYNEGTTTFEWTAFKTNAKVPVAGGFNDIKVTSEKAEDPKDVIKSIEFEINTASVETNVEDRNAKIAEHFFGTINTETITGKFTGLTDDGKATVMITMNGISFDIEGDYKLEGSDFTFKSVIDVKNWNALSGIDALNKVCEELHTGEDGVSKLWSEVSLKLTTSLDSDCD